MGEPPEVIDALMEESSLGTRGARLLRDKVSLATVDAILRRVRSKLQRRWRAASRDKSGGWLGVCHGAKREGPPAANGGKRDDTWRASN
jgi:hypothetical protein